MKKAAIVTALEKTLEREFNFYDIDTLATNFQQLKEDDCIFSLDWLKRFASANTALAYLFASQVNKKLMTLSKTPLNNHLLNVLYAFDSQGLQAASTLLSNLTALTRLKHQLLVADNMVFLNYFLQGLSAGLNARQLTIQTHQSNFFWTDTTQLFLPKRINYYDNYQHNRYLSVTMVAYLWAQLRFGTFHIDIKEIISHYDNAEKALLAFSVLEGVRLKQHLKTALPGIYRHIVFFEKQSNIKQNINPATKNKLNKKNASASDTAQCIGDIYNKPLALYPYQAIIKATLAKQAQKKRSEQEKITLQKALSELAQEHFPEKPPEQVDINLNIDAQTQDTLAFDNDLNAEITLDSQMVATPPHIQNMLASVRMDFADIPPEHLVPAGITDYDANANSTSEESAESVWSGTYHEQGAFIYKEWDFARKHYKKNWCVLRELDVCVADLGFYHQTRSKYKGLLAHLRRSFETLKQLQSPLKRQENGDEIDFNALVNHWSDWLSGAELDSRLFIQKRAQQRDIAVLFMVDVSGSTRGWINQAEREALILMAECLQVLGDRYAIYGFSGWSRKRCEIYKVKNFSDKYDDSVKGKICALDAHKYTRMGVAIRHLSDKLNRVDAKTKILITLSDGKPDDYDFEYRGQYGIEDTKMSLLEAREKGIHPYCITIDSNGKDYLPQLYGNSNYTVIDTITQLPLKISSIYRQLTT